MTNSISKYLSIQNRKLLFNALVLPHFDYCSSVWSNATNSNLETLVKLYKRAGRMLLGVPWTTPTSEVLTSLGWTTLVDRWKYNKCSTLFNVLLSKNPSYIYENFSLSRQNHRYPSRHATSNGLTLPLVKTNFGKRTFHFDSCLVWNNLSDATRQASTKSTFKRLCKKDIEKSA